MLFAARRSKQQSSDGGAERHNRNGETDEKEAPATAARLIGNRQVHLMRYGFAATCERRTVRPSERPLTGGAGLSSQDQESKMTDKEKELEQTDLLRHEALHMASFLMRAVDTELLSHQAVKSNPEWLSLCESAHQSLFDLYQAIGGSTANSAD